jgi:hypothetical protein
VVVGSVDIAGNQHSIDARGMHKGVYLHHANDERGSHEDDSKGLVRGNADHANVGCHRDYRATPIFRHDDVLASEPFRHHDDLANLICHCRDVRVRVNRVGLHHADHLSRHVDHRRDSSMVVRLSC